MSTQKLTSIVRRGSIFVAVFAIVAATFAPAASTYADALNPLTERSLTLSSSAPGWEDEDGSGNSTYAPPNSGANGKKSGNYFGFKVTSASSGATAMKAMSFQYCTQPAGDCSAPGDNSVHGTDTASTADLNVTYPSAAEIDNDDFATVINATSSDTASGVKPGEVLAVPGYVNNNPKYQFAGGTGDAAENAKDVAGNFIVMKLVGSSWVQSEGWTATSSHQEENVRTSQQNTIILQNSTGADFTAGQQVKVLFFATASNYITNPGSGYFFVKINTFKNFDALSTTSGSEKTLRDNITTPGNIIDGGVTVANVMNQSIQITTKVLETMQFSVGTVDPNTLTPTQLQATALNRNTHTPCDIIQTGLTPSSPKNVLELGDQRSESSLSTVKTYATHSYWRLSSNSSAGATVYYSGHTLSNTSGDEIKPIGIAKAASAQGSEQFGLGLSLKDTSTSGVAAFDKATYAVDYQVDRDDEATTPNPDLNYENAADTNDDFYVGGIDPSVLTGLGAADPSGGNYTGLNASYHTPRLNPLVPKANYASGAGKINSDGKGTGNAQFAFDPLSDTIPTAIADESSQVVDCVTGKMRYIANIAATTPAGIYTTKVNYIAAPQY